MNAMSSARSDAPSVDTKGSKSKLATATSGSSRSDALVFPLISPRGIVSNNVAVSNVVSSNAAGQKKPGTFAQLRKPGPPAATSSNNLPMATCWSCGARFTRAMPPSATTVGAKKSASLKALLSARPYCSKECRGRIERSDMSVSPALSVSLQCGDGSPSEVSGSSNGNTKPARPVVTGERASGVANGGRPLHLATAKTAITVVINNSIRKEPEDNAALELLQVGVTKLAQPDHLPIAHPRPPLSTASSSLAPPSTCHSPTGSRARAGAASKSHRGLATASGSFTASQRSVASIPWTNHSLSASTAKATSTEPSLMLSNSMAATAQSRVYQQSRYKLDPEVFQANRVTFSTLFGAFGSNFSAVNNPAAYARGNLLKLQEFMSVRALHRLSLTSHAWHALITQPSALSDALWGVHVLRTWRQSEEDELLLQQIGVLPKPERPRRMLMKLTRQVGRVALENMKVLLSPENWQLAAIMTEADAANTQTLSNLLSTLRRRRQPSDSGSLSPPSLCPKSRQSGGNAFAVQPPPPPELFEHITAIYNPAGEIVAVRAQQLIRPLDDKGESLTSVLQGLQRGTLHAVQCRRLRLFSLANRLPFEQWALLPATRAVFDFFWSKDEPSAVTTSSAPCAPQWLPVWHQKVLAKQQSAMQQRLLGKESVQQVMRGLQERNGPPEVLIFLEKFLVASHAQASAVPRSPRARAVDTSTTGGLS